MAKQRCSATTAGSRRSTPPPPNVLSPVRRSPRALPRLNYREKRARSSSSLGSTGRNVAKQTCLKISLKATLVNSFGETDYYGSGVFMFPEKAHQSSLHVRTREILADVLGAGINSSPVEPVKEVPCPDFKRHQRLYREHRRKARENARVIAQAEVAEIRAARHARELAEARAEKRKIGEPSEENHNHMSPCSDEMAVVKEEEQSKEDNTIPHVRTRSRSTPPSRAPSDW